SAFVTLAAPDVPAGLDRCRVLAAAAPGGPGADRIVVLPGFFFAGDLLERLRMQTAGWAAAHPWIEVLGAEPIGAAPELAEVVMERYRATVADGAWPDAAVGAAAAVGGPA